jgi:hypothetical protein
MRLTEPLATEGEHRCDNCEWEGEVEALRPIRSLESRLDPGGIVPSGECPEGGALASPIQKTRWLFVFHGGVDPGAAVGPVLDDEHPSELIRAARRDDDTGLRAMDGGDPMHWSETDGGPGARPELGSCSGESIAARREPIERARHRG